MLFPLSLPGGFLLVCFDAACKQKENTAELGGGNNMAWKVWKIFVASTCVICPLSINKDNASVDTDYYLGMYMAGDIFATGES